MVQVLHYTDFVAEREGFEPSIRFCRILTFQASAFDHSATAPHALEASPASRSGPLPQPVKTWQSWAMIALRFPRLVGIAALPLLLAAAPEKPEAVTPASVLADAPASAWRALPPGELIVMDLRGGARVVILLATGFAPAHVANIKTMARAGYYDGLWIERVQDGYVVQWGDPDAKKPQPAGVRQHLPAEYDFPAAGVPMKPLPYRDAYAAKVGWSRGWPVASDGRRTWLTHCYGMVGVGRNLAPDTGDGAELYAIIGQPARALDRNITVVGRVLSGMEHITALPRGTGDLGFYKTLEERLPIARVALASDLPPAERPRLAMLDTGSPAFGQWLQVKANRKDDFYVRPAGAVDLCNALPPVKELPR